MSKTEPEERDPDLAAMELDDDIERHMLAWSWPPARFIARLEMWARRARGHFDLEQEKKSDG